MPSEIFQLFVLLPMNPSFSELSVSVIVPVHNGGEKFHQCLLSLTKVNPAPDELIVVADGDHSAQFAKKHGAKVLNIPGPRGPAHARTFGAQHAQGDILFFLDADVAVPHDAIRRIKSIFQSDPSLAAIMGSYDDAPSERNFLSQYKNLFHHYVHQNGSEEASTFWGACGAIRREVFLAMGGFDENYRRPCIEDIELGYRLKRAGYRIRLDKALQVKHLKRWGIVSLVKTDFFQRALPWTELILRDHHFVNDLNLKISSRVSVIAVYGLLVALLGAWLWQGFLAIAGALILLLLFLNAPVYRFFHRKRGFWFAVQTTPWHWLYFFYSGLALVIGGARYIVKNGARRKLNAWKPF